MARSTAYYLPQVNLEDLKIMNLIDEIYTEFPYYGKRRMAAELQRRGCSVGKCKARTLMREMGLEAIYPKPNTSKSHPEHRIFPYLLRNLDIIRPNQVWGTDITYIRLPGGWAYLVAFLDWYSRYVVSWQLSNTMESDFCVEALERGLRKATPEISNSDQGSQFTSNAFIDVLRGAEIEISMDGRGRCMDNIFTERLWRSLKYEEVYLKEYRDLSEAHKGISEYFHRYNHRRLHQSLDYQTPAEIYFQTKS
jgi:putative transposase